jgi:hypothetical protein
MNQRTTYDDISAMNASTIVHGYDGVGLEGVRTSMRRLKRALDGERKATEGMIFGIQYHSLILEPEEFEKRFTVVPDFGKMEGNVDGKGNPSTSASTTWAKRRKAQFFADCEAEGIDIVHDADRRIAENKLDRLRGIVRGLKDCRRAQQMLAECAREVTLQGEIDGIPYKGLVDLLGPNGSYFADLKGTVSASDVPFGKKQCNLNIDIKLAVYRELICQNFGAYPSHVDLIAIETDGAFDCAVYRVPDDLIDFGRLKLKVLHADYRKAVATNNWPGVQPYNSGDAPYMFVPNWAMPNEDLELDIAEQFREGAR